MLNSKNYFYYYILFIFINILSFYYSQTFILTDDLYRLIVGSQMTNRQLDDYLKFVHKWRWVSYFFIPVALLLRISFTWVCLKVGSFITERFINISFWKICIQAEIIFALETVVGLLYTEFFVDIQNLKQLSVNPFSLQIFVSNSVPNWSSYFFNTLNVFELGYIFFLAYFIAKEAKSKVLLSFRFVVSTYLPGLFFWLLLVSYVSVVFQS